MLRAFRGSRLARCLLLAAGLVAACASFGLHPEPGAAPAESSRVARWSPPGERPAPAHACPACLAHSPVRLAGPAPVVLTPEVADAAAPAFVALFPDRPESRTLQTRAPPVAS